LYLGPEITLYTLPTVVGTSLLGVRDGRIAVFATVTVRDRRITHFDAVINPARLAPLGQLLGLG
jgi:hypothetical protein